MEIFHDEFHHLIIADEDMVGATADQNVLDSCSRTVGARFDDIMLNDEVPCFVSNADAVEAYYPPIFREYVVEDPD